MDFNAIGLIELNSVVKDIEGAEEMIKAGEAELLMSRTACPCRYLAMIAGDVGAVEDSIGVGKRVAGEFLVDNFVIPNVHPSVFPALSCATSIPELDALGVIETYSSASCILAADAAAKAGDVELIEIRCATGLAGKSFVTMTGDVDSVNASVSAGIDALVQQDLELRYRADEVHPPCPL